MRTLACRGFLKCSSLHPSASVHSPHVCKEVGHLFLQSLGTPRLPNGCRSSKRLPETRPLLRSTPWTALRGSHCKAGSRGPCGFLLVVAVHQQRAWQRDCQPPPPSPRLASLRALSASSIDHSHALVSMLTIPRDEMGTLNSQELQANS